MCVVFHVLPSPVSGSPSLSDSLDSPNISSSSGSWIVCLRWHLVHVVLRSEHVPASHSPIRPTASLTHREESCGERAREPREAGNGARGARETGSNGLPWGWEKGGTLPFLLSLEMPWSMAGQLGREEGEGIIRPVEAFLLVDFLRFFFFFLDVWDPWDILPLPYYHSALGYLSPWRSLVQVGAETHRGSLGA